MKPVDWGIEVRQASIRVKELIRVEHLIHSAANVREILGS